MAPSRRFLSQTTEQTAMTSHASTFEELAHRSLRYQEARNLSTYTIRNTRQGFNCFRAFLAVRGIRLTADGLTSDLLREYQLWLRDTPLPEVTRGDRTRTPGGIAVRMRQLRAFVRWLQEEEIITHRVRVSLPALPKEMPPVLTDTQVAAVFACRHLSGSSALAARNRAIFSLLLDTGLRVSEICAIEDRDLYLASGMVRVVGKGHKERIVPFCAATEAAIKAWIKLRDAYPVSVAGAGRGKTFELAAGGLQSLTDRIAAEVGFKCHPHLWRHTAATALLRQGMDLHSLKRILGHSHISTTEIYLSLTNEDLKAKHAAASPVALLVPEAAPSEPPRRRSLRAIEGGRKAS